MTTGWIPIFVLPNIQLQKAIGCDAAALAPARDDRVSVIKRAQPNFRRFLNRFSDNFGEKFEPAVLLVRAPAPAALTAIAALASFRDLIAIATITYSRALELRHRRGLRVMFGEAFAIYPWMLDRHYEEVIGSTPAILGTHEVSKFRGQSSPAIFRTTLCESDVDQPLLSKLLERWTRYYEMAGTAWEDVALMRSLNMAYHASLLPAGTETTIYDVGRIAALWVSAFEILAHPGGNGIANRDKVFALIESTPWEIRESGALVYDTGGKSKVKRTLASWLYQTLYECRHDFLHGNPVDPIKYTLTISGRTVFDFAAPLYRLALTAFLPLAFDQPMPGTEDPAAFAHYIAGQKEFSEPQKCAEKALFTAMNPPFQMHSRSAPVTRRSARS
jgi:hypothetical protein